MRWVFPWSFREPSSEPAREKGSSTYGRARGGSVWGSTSSFAGAARTAKDSAAKIPAPSRLWLRSPTHDRLGTCLCRVWEEPSSLPFHKVHWLDCLMCRKVYCLLAWCIKSLLFARLIYQKSAASSFNVSRVYCSLACFILSLILVGSYQLLVLVVTFNIQHCLLFWNKAVSKFFVSNKLKL